MGNLHTDVTIVRWATCERLGGQGFCVDVPDLSFSEAARSAFNSKGQRIQAHISIISSFSKAQLRTPVQNKNHDRRALGV